MLFFFLRTLQMNHLKIHYPAEFFFQLQLQANSSQLQHYYALLYSLPKTEMVEMLLFLSFFSLSVLDDF